MDPTLVLAGFGAPNDAGVWEGIDVDVCRAVAAAVFGDASKVEYVPTTTKKQIYCSSVW